MKTQLTNSSRGTFEAGVDLQIRMNQAFENYIALSGELLSDGEMLFEMKDIDTDTDIRWKRNFIRTAVAIIEGYSHCIRQIAVIGVEYDAQELPEKEREALESKNNSGICERIKFTLKGAYQMFALNPSPDFGTENWKNAQEGLKRRHLLMHPKTLADLEISTESWSRIYSGFTWLFDQHFSLIKLLYKRHGKRSS